MAYMETLKNDPSQKARLFKVLGLLKPVKKLMQAGKVLDAEKNLDQVLAMRDGQTRPTVREKHSSKWSRIQVPGVKTRGGIFDPSIVHDPKSGTLWMAYSSIFGPGRFSNTKAGPFIRTSLAKSSDGAKSWTFVKHLNDSTYSKLSVSPLGSLEGAWRAEVPQLVYTPGDRGAEWKLFVHRYFWDKKKDRLPVLGWIAYQSAPTPEGPWSKEVPYFGANNRFPLSPYNKVRFTLGNFPKLKSHGFVAYSETGALFHDGVLYVALVGLKKHGPDSVVLLTSNNYGRTWQCAETCIIANREDARGLGYDHLDGVGLALVKGQPSLLASPGKPSLLHDGTFVLPFADIARGKLQRTRTGTLKVATHVAPQKAFINPTGGGQSTYSEWKNQRVFLMPQTNFTTYPDVFNIYRRSY